MRPEHGMLIIRKFVDELEYLQQEKVKYLPEWIEQGIAHLDELILNAKTEGKKWWQFVKYYRFKEALMKLTVIDCFGFNSSKFDLPTIFPTLIMELKKRSQKISVLKKMTCYLNISTDKISFKDVLRKDSQ